MSDILDRANDHLRKHAGKIDLSQRPRYHLAPPVGWMNDPNGVCSFGGETHIFYQYFPYDSCWGPMHWGHAVTRDNCVFRHCAVALAPDREDEGGCFSGGAVVSETGELFVYYTKHFEADGVRKELQGMARSADGLHFHKREVPVLTEGDLPSGASREDFRDPNPVRIGGEYFLFVGSKNERNEGQVLVYASSDGEHFSYRNALRSPYFGEMAECPDFFSVGETDVLLVSAIGVKREGNRFLGPNSSLYFLGKFDPKACTFRIDACDEIDGGHAFYAPQTCADESGRRLLFAWMEMWGKEYFLHRNGHGYCGAIVYPRVLSVRDGALWQSPASGIERYRRAADFTGEVLKCFDLSLRFAEGGLLTVSDASDEGDMLSVSLCEGRVKVDLSSCRQEPAEARFSKFAYGGEAEIRILSDVSSLEIFVADGRETFAERYYFKGEKVRIRVVGARIEEGYELALPDEDFAIWG